jgi:uncharacterized protein
VVVEAQAVGVLCDTLRVRTYTGIVGFDVARTGVASVGFIGFPSVGKSTLMSRVTGQHSEAAAYEFTTLTTVPGQVLYNGAKIQMLDLPGIIQGAKDGKGRGRQVIAVAKTCHLIFIVLDVNKPLTDKRVIEQELEGFGIRINKEPPNITFRKKDKGGINITSTCPLTHIDNDVRFPIPQNSSGGANLNVGDQSRNAGVPHLISGHYDSLRCNN